ncbi:MAG: C2 domain-containing protein, partial [Myxococcota bacterium]
MHSSRLRISAGSALGRRHLIGGLVAVAGGACIRKPNLGEAGFRTRLAPPPAGLTLDPPAPPNLFWLSISSARVPPRAPGGRMWDRTSGWPDVVVRVSFAGRVQLETPSATNRLEPTWTRGVASANFELLPDTVLEVEMRDVDTFRDKPIGRGQLLRPSAADLARGEVEINVGRPGNRGNVILDVETAHALWGTGFDYERVSGGVVVSRVLKHSPAARAGL